MTTAYTNTIFDLQDKVAVVIGGTGELCGQMAEGLASAGAKVVLVGRDPAKAKTRIESIESLGGNAVFEACDVGSKKALESLAEKVFSDHGKVDILINGAGVNSATPFLEIEEEELDRILNVNFRSVFLISQVFGAKWLDSGANASLINVGSMSGVIPLSRVFTYSATKAAVHNLSKNLAREWATSGIRVNTLVPGFFPAEQNRKVLTKERVTQIMGHTPMDRFGKPQELIGATLLLASDAGSFMTGTEILVDGGYACMTI